MSYNFNVENARNAGSKGYPFWNPSNDFNGVIACLGEIRHIQQKGKMKGDLDVVDVTVYGTETAKITEEKDGKKTTMEQSKEYKGENFSMIINQKKVINSKIQSFVPLTGKKLVMLGLGKPTNKPYYDYYIKTEEQAKADSVLA